MWESPIDILRTNFETELEGDVIKAISKYGIDIDKDRLLEMLRGDRRSYDMGYATGKREVCERIIRRLAKEFNDYNDRAETELEECCLEMFHHYSDKADGLERAVEIIREEM